MKDDHILTHGTTGGKTTSFVKSLCILGERESINWVNCKVESEKFFLLFVAFTTISPSIGKRLAKTSLSSKTSSIDNCFEVSYEQQGSAFSLNLSLIVQHLFILNLFEF